MAGMIIEYRDSSGNTKRVPIHIVEEIEKSWQYSVSHYPIEAGEDIYDHHSIKPLEIKAEAIIPEVTEYTDTTDFNTSSSKVLTAKIEISRKTKDDILLELVSIANNGYICNLLIEGEGIWNNYVIENFSLTTNIKNGSVYKIPLQFKHVVLVSVDKGNVPAEILATLSKMEQQVANANASEDELSTEEETYTDILSEDDPQLKAKIAGWKAGFDKNLFEEAKGWGSIFDGTKPITNLDLTAVSFKTSGALGAVGAGYLGGKSKTYAITSLFGWRIAPTKGASKYHKGWDLGCPEGTILRAPFTGRFYFSRESGYGNVVSIVQEDKPYIVRFCHLSKANHVREKKWSKTGDSWMSGVFANGQMVAKGAFVAYTGHSGIGTGAHLHIEIVDTKTGKRIDPANYFCPNAEKISKEQFKLTGGKK